MTAIQPLEDQGPGLTCNRVPRKTRIQILEDYIAERRAELQELECRVAGVKSAIDLHLQLLLEERTKQGFQASGPDVQLHAVYHRSPMDMLRPQFKGKRLAEIIATVLEENQLPMTTTELSRIIYEVWSDEELYRARNSLSAELRTGANTHPPKWQKLGRYAYAALSRRENGM